MRFSAKKQPILIAPLLILLLAAMLRLPFMDAYPLWADEFSVQLEGIRIAVEGQRPLIGTEATFQGLTHHSTFTSYILAIPYTLFPDPGLARAFVGLLGVLTVAIWYATVKRYFGRHAAAIAALLIATLPIAVYWSRFVWNPTLGLVFIPLWFYTGLCAYHEGKRSAQVLHWLLVSANVQSQAVLIYLLPISLGLFVWHLLRHPQRIRTIIATGIGIVLFVMSVIPWGIGLSRYAENNPSASENVDVGGVLSSFNFAGLKDVPFIFGRVIGATEFPASEINWQSNPDGLWTQIPFYIIGWITVLLTLAGIIWLLRRGLQTNLPSLLIATMCLAPFGIILFASPDQPITDHFFMPATFAASAAVGVFASQVQQRWLIGVLILIISGYLLTTASYLYWLQQHPHDHPNGNLTALSQQAKSFLNYGDSIVMLRERSAEVNLQPPENYQAGELFWSWYVMSTRYPITPIGNPSNTLIFPMADRVAIVSRSFSEIIPTWFSASDLIGYNDRYRIVTLQANTSETLTQFGQIARLIGAYHDDTLCDGQAGSVTMWWQPLVNQPPDDYHFSIRLVDAEGSQHAQTDVPTLHHEFWQTADSILSHIELPQPTNAVSRMRVILYNAADSVSVDVVDAQANPVSYFAELPLNCSPSEP